MKSTSKQADGAVAVNRRARYDYEIESTWEAGVMLSGSEVKSARRNEVQIAEAYAAIDSSGHAGRSAEAWLHNAYFAPYKEANDYNGDPRRKRKLLLHRSEIQKLATQVQQKGYTLVPIKMYFKAGKLKLLIGVGKGRKNYDKRQNLEKRQSKREMKGEV
ncbi:MAG: SsrA-binding protein SmpB [Abditibacteriaceae bacterium]